MKIYLPNQIERQLILALEKAGTKEIGGVLMGEYIGEAEFRIVDLTIQKQRGTFAFFVRLVADAVAHHYRDSSSRRNITTKNLTISVNGTRILHSHPRRAQRICNQC